MKKTLIALMMMFAAIAASADSLPPTAQAPDLPQKRVTTYPWTTPEKWFEAHERNLSKAKHKKIDVLFLGDSITKEFEAGGKAVWAQEYLPLGAANFGVSSDTTQNLLWRITEGGELDYIDPSIVVLMIGTNNFSFSKHNPEQVATGISKIVKTITEKLPHARIILIGILPRGKAPNTKIRADVFDTNTIISKLDDRKTVFYLDMGNNFLQEDGSISKSVLRDYLHPSPDGYQIWADTMRPLLNDLQRQN